MQQNNDEERQAVERAQEIITEARQDIQREPLTVSSLREAMAIFLQLEQFDGDFCLRMNTAGDILIAMIIATQEGLPTTPKEREQWLFQLKLIGGVLADHHEALHVLKSGITAHMEKSQ